MTPRDLALRLITLLAFAVIVAAALVLTLLRALAVELADEVAASRRERLPAPNSGVAPGTCGPERDAFGALSKRGTMQPKNTKLTDVVSQHRAANAKLAAVLGVNTMQARSELSAARQLASELAMARRAS